MSDFKCPVCGSPDMNHSHSYSQPRYPFKTSDVLSKSLGHPPCQPDPQGEPQCEAGCTALTGNETRHHKDCPFYPESMTRMLDQAQARVAELEQRLAKAAESATDLLMSAMDERDQARDEVADTVELMAKYKAEAARLRETLEGDTLTAKRVYALLEQRDRLRSALEWIASGQSDPDAGENGAVLTAREALKEKP